MTLPIRNWQWYWQVGQSVFFQNPVTCKLALLPLINEINLLLRNSTRGTALCLHFLASTHRLFRCCIYISNVFLYTVCETTILELQKRKESRAQTKCAGRSTVIIISSDVCPVPSLRLTAHWVDTASTFAL